MAIAFPALPSFSSGSFLVSFCEAQNKISLVKKFKLNFARSDYPIDTFVAAKDTIKQFEVNISDPEAMESIAERRVTTKTRPQSGQDTNWSYGAVGSPNLSNGAVQDPNRFLGEKLIV